MIIKLVFFHILILLYGVLLVFLPLDNLYASEYRLNYKSYNFPATEDSFSYELPEHNVVAFSEKIHSDSDILVRWKDYDINYNTGIITFNNLHFKPGVYNVEYMVIPDFLLHKYVKYKMQAERDSLISYTSKNRFPFLQSGSENLIISGSKTISLTISNTNDYDLNQSLYLTLKGELSKSLSIEGRLSDSQSSLTPEGDTHELSNLDQVYLRLFGKHFSMLMGDQEYTMSELELMNYKTKFEGITAEYSGRFHLMAAAAVNGGKQLINIIQGIDGKQGPYYLTAGESGQRVQVVSGSEKISLDGKNIDRGIDYIIDYAEGSVIFKKLITSSSRIFVEFNYTDDYYRQSLYLSVADTALLPNLDTGYSLISQTDDKINPLLWSFSEADKDSLRNAGDGIAWGQGVFEVDPGSGSYIIKTDSNNNEYYEYAPGDSTARFLVYFSYVGFGLGDYEPMGTDKYQYKGKYLGSYLPVKKLIPPTSKTNLGLYSKYHFNEFELNLEGVLTYLDKNTFSPADDKDNNSFLSKVTCCYSPKDILLNPVFDLSYFRRGKNSLTFSNLNSATENYELSYIPVFDSLKQDVLASSLHMNIQDRFSQNFSYTYKDIYHLYIQKMLKLDNLIYQSKFNPEVKWYSLFSSQNYRDSVNTNSNIQYHDASLQWKRSNLIGKANLIYRKALFSNNSDNSSYNLLNGTKSLKVSPALSYNNQKNFGTDIVYISESNSSKSGSTWNHGDKSDTYQLSNYVNGTNHTVNLNASVRTAYSKSDDSGRTSQSKKQYELIDFKSSHRFADNSLSVISSYQLNRLEFYPRLKLLEYTGEGLGQYDSTGVLTENGDYEYVYIAGHNGQLTSEINTAVNLNYHLSPKYLPDSIWHKFKLESNWQAALNSSDLKFLGDYFSFSDDLFNSDSTKYGKRIVQHTLWIDVWKKIIYCNLKYVQGKTMDDRYQEKSINKNRDTGFDFDIRYRVGLQARTSLMVSKEEDSRYDTIVASTDLSEILSFMFRQGFSSQFTLGYISEKGNSDSQELPYRINTYKLSPNLTFFFKNKYRLTSNMLCQYNIRSGSDLLSFLPEKRNGFILNFTSQLQYKFNSYTSGSFQYTGKSYPHNNFQHELRMEFRAEL